MERKDGCGDGLLVASVVGQKDGQTPHSKPGQKEEGQRETGESSAAVAEGVSSIAHPWPEAYVRLAAKPFGTMTGIERLLDQHRVLLGPDHQTLGAG